MAEINLDGIVGPTHNYSGLSYGNIASEEHKDWISNPRAAAKQGLRKMQLLMERGAVQGFLPPQERPHFPTLRLLGFKGSHRQVIESALKEAPEIYFACCSASSMWCANAATVTPSIDSGDSHVHITPANLSSELHRSIEAEMTGEFLKIIFPDPHYFTHHPPLPGHFSDEGAANHSRFSLDHSRPGIHLFVYGNQGKNGPKRYPARQSREASEAIARLHKIFPGRAIFAEQNPEAIDLGVFHNDVISTGNCNLFLYHEEAFLKTQETVEKLQAAFEKMCGEKLILLPVSKDEVPIEDAVASYLFNSQIISTKSGLMTMFVPSECEQIPSVEAFLQKILRDSRNPINEVIAVDLRESMQNGGGPACLRLRVPLTDQELEAVSPKLILTESLCRSLDQWIDKYYPERLSHKELSDPAIVENCLAALDELTRLLRLGPIYSFQK